MSDVIASWSTPTSLFLLLNVVIGTIFLISRLSPPKTPSHHGGGYSSAPTLQRAPSLIDRVKSVNFSTFKFAVQNQEYFHHDNEDDHHGPQVQHVDNYLASNPLDRAPSILERVKSINLSLHKYPPPQQNPNPVYVQHHHQQQQQPALTRAPSFLDRVKSIDFKSYYRSDSGKLNPETAHLQATTEETAPVHVKRSKSEHDNVKQRNFQEKMNKSASEKFKEKDHEEEEVERRRPETTRIEKTTSIGDGDYGVDAKADDFITKFKQQLRLQRLDSLLRYRDMIKSKASN